MSVKAYFAMMSFACSQLTFGVIGTTAGSDGTVGALDAEAVGFACGTGAFASRVPAFVAFSFLGGFSGREAIACERGCLRCLVDRAFVFRSSSNKPKTELCLCPSALAGLFFLT